jgi:hypothetical protein
MTVDVIFSETLNKETPADRTALLEQLCVPRLVPRRTAGRGENGNRLRIEPEKSISHPGCDERDFRRLSIRTTNAKRKQAQKPPSK